MPGDESNFCKPDDDTDKSNKSKVLSTFEEMLEDLFGFAMNRTRHRMEAEDLVQAISVEVIRSWKSIRSSEAVKGWVWSIARHTYAKWVRGKSRDKILFMSEGLQARAFTSWDSDPAGILAITEDAGELRREIALLSRSYRDVIVSYYLRERSHADIAAAFGLPLSTVKWRLHEARRILEEGLSNMREFGRLSLSPKKIHFGSYGNWSPGDHLGSLLRQNIFLASYRKPITLSDLAVELGVSAAFIEDEVASMVSLEALEQIPGNKVRTTFILHTAEAHKAVEPILDDLEKAISPILETAPEHLRSNLGSRFFSSPSISWEKISSIVVPEMIYAACGDLEKDIASYEKRPKHANGETGWAIAWEVLQRSNDLSRTNGFMPGTRYGWIDQAIYWNASHGWRKFLDAKDLEVICRIALEDANGAMNIPQIEKDKHLEEEVSRLMASGHLIREDDWVKPRFAVFTKAQKDEYDRAAEPILEPLKRAMANAHGNIVNALLSLIPGHLHGQAPIFALCLITDMPSSIPLSFDPEWPYGMRLVAEKNRPAD